MKPIIRMVEISKHAHKQLTNVPSHIVKKLMGWVASVELEGLEKVRRIPGYHDEPLKGSRQGQRSIRLSKAYRAIYEIKNNGTIEFVSIEEVSKHDY